MPESHRICDQCDAEKTTPFTDAQLQARVEELEALIHKVAGSTAGDDSELECDPEDALEDTNTNSEYDEEDDDDDKTKAENDEFDDARTANNSVHRRSLTLPPFSFGSSADIDIPEEVTEHL